MVREPVDALKKWGARAGVVVLCLSCALGAYLWLHISSPIEPVRVGAQLSLPHRLRNSDEHDIARSRNGGNPYILELEKEDAALLYYGASHTRDPAHPQIADITARWERFRPTVALREGRRARYYWGALIEPFAGLPEPALVHKLAARDGVPVLSLEPSYEDEVAALLARFDAQDVALYFFIRVYSTEAGGVANEALARDLLAKRTDVAGLRGALPNLAAVDRVWGALYTSDWRENDSEPTAGLLAEISTESRRLRGEHMIRVLWQLVEQGERVFAVVGSGHVIRQEWNLRTLFGAAAAWDQPTFEE